MYHYLYPGHSLYLNYINLYFQLKIGNWGVSIGTLDFPNPKLIS